MIDFLNLIQGRCNFHQNNPLHWEILCRFTSSGGNSVATYESLGGCYSFTWTQTCKGFQVSVVFSTGSFRDCSSQNVPWLCCISGCSWRSRAHRAQVNLRLPCHPAHDITDVVFAVCSCCNCIFSGEPLAWFSLLLLLNLAMHFPFLSQAQRNTVSQSSFSQTHYLRRRQWKQLSRLFCMASLFYYLCFLVFCVRKNISIHLLVFYTEYNVNFNALGMCLSKLTSVSSRKSSLSITFQ